MDRERITSDSMGRLPRVKVDVIVLVVLVVTALTLLPGHGLWGWALALVAVVSVGVVVGILGRRYPWISGQPPRARRTRRS
jgi:O-antigen/teichoic acid export membrane protein